MRREPGVGETAEAAIQELEALLEREGSASRTPSANRDAWVASVAEGVAKLVADAPAEMYEPEVSRVASHAELLRAAVAIDDGEETDLRRCEMLDLVRVVGRQLTQARLTDPIEARAMLLAHLGGTPAPDLAPILGIDPDTLPKWWCRPLTPADETRLTTLAWLVSRVSGSYTPLGVLLWLRTPRSTLSGRTALDVLNEDPGAARERLAPLLDPFRG